VERALLDLLTSHTSLAIAVSDVDGTLTSMSPGLERMLGWTFRPLSEAEVATELSLYDETGTVRLSAPDLPMARARRGELVQDVVVTVPRGTGRKDLTYLRCNAAPLKNPKGGTCGAFLLVVDVTAERMAAMRAEEFRDQLVTMVNHELRTPLTKLVGHVDVLTDAVDTLPPALRPGVETIGRAVADLARLSATISQLVDIDAATQASPAPADLVPQVRAAARVLQGSYRRGGVELRLDVPDSLVMDVDAELVRRAVRGLLRDALTLAVERSVVTVRLDETDDCARLTIAGEAHTLDEAAAPGAALVTASTSTESRRHLGWALAHSVAVAHAGTLRLDRDGRRLEVCMTLRRSRS
jgi:signal transduction histidine kinase